ncbi:MAG TPA: RidA family protein [Sphaerochaetaceae bacterium]|jgi:2-iminobutanoate/2-iminopropanoate deaminase|nr:RidA family protein [Sphaerochaetaceae bacterium]
MKKIIETKHAPAAVGPYAQAYLVNDTLYVSGQIPFVPETMQLVSDDVAVQTKRSLENIAAIVKEAGFSITDIVKCQVFLKDMNDFARVNEVYAQFFGSHTPARIAVEVSRLPKDVSVEIDAICVK